jgi:hypothetical protein
LQFAPWQLHTDALHVHDPDVWQTRLHVLTSQVQVLESVQVRVHCPVVDWQLATHVSEPLHVRLHGPTADALHDRFFVPMLLQPPSTSSATSNQPATNATRVRMRSSFHPKRDSPRFHGIAG